MSQKDFDRGFDQGFRACLDQIKLTGLEPLTSTTTNEFLHAARRRLGLEYGRERKGLWQKKADFHIS